MPMRRQWSARFPAGALFLLAALSAAAARGETRIEIAASRPGGACLGQDLLALIAPPEPPAAGPRCLAVLSLGDLSDTAIDGASRRISELRNVSALVLRDDLDPASPTDETRLDYAVKTLSSKARADFPGVKVALDFTGRLAEGKSVVVSDSGLPPYADALVGRPGRGRYVLPEVAARWLLVPATPGVSPPDEVLRSLSAIGDGDAAVALVGYLPGAERAAPADAGSALERLQRYWTKDVSRDPTATRATRADGSAAAVLRFFDAKALTPILLLPSDPAGTVSIELSGGPFTKVSVENLATGAKRDFDLAGAKTLSLDLSKGPLAAALRPAGRGGETRAEVAVGAERKLTADEIVAKERVWDAGQRERMHAFIAAMKTSLRFRIAEVNETFDLTILGTLYSVRGKEPDWAWHEFYLNGVKWKGKTLPKLPILQPEKVTALPLDIRLTEDYAYELRRETTVSGRRAYEIAFAPKASAGDKPVYRGTAWIDTQTFALLRRDSIQQNLKGETLSNVQSEIYAVVPGSDGVVLPLQITGEQVFSTAGRTTAIERDVVMSDVSVNPPDYAEKLAAEHASPAQMIRDTDRGLRYLVPDPANPAARVVEERVSRKSTFGLLGGFYDASLDYPIPLVGLQHFNFDLWQKGKQLSVFFGGALLTVNYTDPSLGGSRFDLGADLFGAAIPFGDVSYKDGKEVSGEKIKHLPAIVQVNVGRPLGPWLKASLGIVSKWDNYQRDEDTAPAFVTPVDTFTNGAALKLVANFSGFNVTADVEHDRRVDWPFWGLPGNPDYSADKKNYWKWSVSVAKDQYFPGFRKLHVGIEYLGGSNLDRFSRYEFGTFSGHPINGYKSGSLRTEQALVMNLSYGLNIEDIIRFEGFYDQALVKDEISGFENAYFSGAGILASLNGPFKNSIIRGQVGVPVVSHGVHGVVVNVLLLKLF
jgi:hypothetical protein